MRDIDIGQNSNSNTRKVASITNISQKENLPKSMLEDCIMGEERVGWSAGKGRSLRK